MSRFFRALYFITASAILPLAAQVPANVPTQYQAIYSNMTTQIGAFQTAVNQGWNGTPYPVAWAPHLSSAESDSYLSLLAPGYYSATVMTELLEIQATGAKAVTVHMNFPILYQPFYTYMNTPTVYGQFVAFYQQLARDVHARGMKLIAEATVAEALDGTSGAQFEPYYQSLDWNDYMNARAQNAVNVAQLIQPDYLSLICEPDSEATNASQPTEDSPTGAMQLLQTMLSAFQQSGGTNVLLGAGAGTWISNYTTYVQDFSTTSLNYIDVHVYLVNNSDLINVLTGMSIIQQSGKAIGVSEAWPNKVANSELNNLNVNMEDSRDVFSFWAPIDTAFLQAMVDCTQYEKAAFFSPSYPTYFAAYLDYNTYGTDSAAQLLPLEFSTGASANDAGAFTSTGVAFSTMIVGVDKTAPATPAAPTASSISSTGATITWTPTTDNIGVAGYNVYRNGVVVSRLAMPPLYDTGLTAGASYTYSLSAFDAQGNVSAQSPVLNITILDLSPPSVPSNLAVTSFNQNSVSLSWSPSTGGGGVGGYRFLKGNSPSALNIVNGYVLGTTYTDQTASPGTKYYYAVESYNLLGISSTPSAIVTATTLALPPPTGLTASSVTKTSLILSWTASGGSDAPVGYRILKGTASSSLHIIVASNPGTTYVDNALAPQTTYYYEVEMVDSLGRTSAPSNMLAVTSAY